MHSSQDAAGTWSPVQTSQQRAGNLSFPPTQRTGLLRSTASATASARSQRRSNDQAVNFAASCRALLERLSPDSFAHNAAM